MPAVIHHRQYRVVRQYAETGTNLLAHGFVQQKRELSGLVIHVVLETGQAALQRLQLVGQMQASEHSRASSVDVAGADRDGGHQVVHPFGEMFNPAWLLGSDQGIRLVEDSDTDRFRVWHGFSLSSFMEPRKTGTDRPSRSGLLNRARRAPIALCAP